MCLSDLIARAVGLIYNMPQEQNGTLRGLSGWVSIRGRRSRTKKHHMTSTTQSLHRESAGGEHTPYDLSPPSSSSPRAGKWVKRLQDENAKTPMHYKTKEIGGLIRPEYAITRLSEICAKEIPGRCRAMIVARWCHDDFTRSPRGGIGAEEESPVRRARSTVP